MINSFKHAFNQVEYKSQSKFILPRNLTSNNLIEANMNAMKTSYDLDKELYKDLIGNLNWKKFSDRIQNQLTSNVNLTIEQKQVMEINAIVAQLLSHQFAEAKEQLKKIEKTNKHPAIKGIGVYFLLKDKKYEQALKLMEKETDPFSKFLKAQILLNDKKQKDAFETLISTFQDA